MPGVLARLKSGGLVASVLTLVTGTALAQLLQLAIQPLLTRLYSPAEFGVFTVYSTWMSNLAVVATARYEMAIVLPAEDRPARALMLLSMVVVSLLSLLVLAVLLAGSGPVLASRFAGPGLAGALVPLLWFLPLSLWLAGLNQSWTNWNNRHRRYRANAAGRFAQAGGMAVASLLGGWMAVGPAGLLAGQLAGQASNVLCQAWQDVRGRFGWARGIGRGDLDVVARRYAEFPRVNAAHAFVGGLQDTVTISMLGVLAGSDTVGFYGRMMLMVRLPVALIGQAVSQVAYREFAACRHAGKPLRPMLLRLMAILLGLGLLPFLVISFWGAPLFALVLGHDWVTAGRYAEAVAPFILLHFVASPLSMLPLVVERQRAAFLISLLQMALFIGALWAGFVLYAQAEDALRVLAWVMVVYFMAYFGWLYRIAK